MNRILVSAAFTLTFCAWTSEGKSLDALQEGALGGQGGGIVTLQPGDTADVGAGWVCTNYYQFTVRVESRSRGAWFLATRHDGSSYPLKCKRSSLR